MDKIYVSGMKFYGYHGVFPEENKLGQRFIVDVTLELPLKAAGATDDLEETVNYATVYETVKEVVEGPPKKLVESVAEEIAARLLLNPKIHFCTIKMIKPDPPINGHYDSVAVEIGRGTRGSNG
ncbi:dihydroneopterin aldolase [Lottiidibacillus patelloidae]|uniref:7,8-dihydroneopterin aldolase n=1 Tax=Lottiidibacillus patelloidae TaxID=2670334 RepID=A0A263BQ72_9BACI|nr:dihydroneopterin aldolase [Lottiidibacillus patelloidae]